MGLFTSIGSFFKDYSSIIFDETDYTSGNIDVSKTTYLRRDSFFVENSIYYNQLRYELINKAFEIDETTFAQGLTKIPVQSLSVTKQNYMSSIKDSFLSSRDSVSYRYADILSFRTSIVETLLSAVTFAAYSGDIDKQIDVLLNAINRVCKLSNTFDDKFLEIQDALARLWDIYNILSEIDTYEEYLEYFGDTADISGNTGKQGNLLDDIKGILSEIKDAANSVLYQSATGDEPDPGTVIDNEFLEKLYQNPYEDEYHLIIKSTRDVLKKNCTAKLSVPQEYFVNYTTYSDTLYLDLKTSADVLVQTGDQDTPIIVNNAGDLSLNNPSINLTQEPGLEVDTNMVFFRFMEDIDLSAVPASSGFINSAGVGNRKFGIYIDLNGKKLTIPDSITLGIMDVDEDSESMEGAITIYNGEIAFAKDSVCSSSGSYNGKKSIKVRGGSSIENSTISFKEDTSAVPDLNDIGRRDILQIDLSEGAIFKSCILENATDYGMVFDGTYPRVIVNQKKPNTTVENIHGNSIKALHNKHIIFKFYFPIFWSSVGRVSYGAKDADEVCYNDPGISSGSETDSSLFSNENGKVKINYGEITAYKQLAKDTEITALPLVYIRDSGQMRVFTCTDIDAIDNGITIGETGKPIKLVQFNIKRSGGNKTTAACMYLQYDDDTIFKDIVTLSGENSAIKEYFYKDEGLEEVEKACEEIDTSIEDMNESQNTLNNNLKNNAGAGGTPGAGDPEGSQANDNFVKDFISEIDEMMKDILDKVEGMTQNFDGTRRDSISKALDKFEGTADQLKTIIACATLLDEERANNDPNYTDQFISDILADYEAISATLDEMYSNVASGALMEAITAATDGAVTMFNATIKDVANIKDALNSGVAIKDIGISNIFLTKKSVNIRALQKDSEKIYNDVNKLFYKILDVHSDITDIIDQFSVNMNVNRDDTGIVKALQAFIDVDMAAQKKSSTGYTSKFLGRGARNFSKWLATVQETTGNIPLYEAAMLYIVSEFGLMCGRITPNNVNTSKKNYHGQLIINLINRCIFILSRKGLWREFISENFRTALSNEEYLYKSHGLRIDRYFMHQNVDSTLQILFPKIREFNDYDIMQIMDSPQKCIPEKDFNECKFIFTQRLLQASKNVDLLNSIVSQAIQCFKLKRRTIRTRLLEGPFYSALWDIFFVSYDSYLNEENINSFLTELLSRQNINDPSKSIFYNLKKSENTDTYDNSGFLNFDIQPESITSRIYNIRGYVELLYKYRMYSIDNELIVYDSYYLKYSDYVLNDVLTKFIYCHKFYYDPNNTIATYLSTDLILEKIPFYNIFEGNFSAKRGIYRASYNNFEKVISKDMLNDTDIYYYYRQYASTDAVPRFIPLEFYKESYKESDGTDAYRYKVPVSYGDPRSAYSNNEKFLLDYIVKYREYFILNNSTKNKIEVPFLGAQVVKNIETIVQGSGTTSEETKNVSFADEYHIGSNKKSKISYEGFQDLGYYAPPFMGDVDFPEQYDIQEYVLSLKTFLVNKLEYQRFSDENNRARIYADGVVNIYVQFVNVENDINNNNDFTTDIEIVINNEATLDISFICYRKGEGFIAAYEEQQPIFREDADAIEGIPDNDDDKLFALKPIWKYLTVMSNYPETELLYVGIPFESEDQTYVKFHEIVQIVEEVKIHSNGESASESINDVNITVSTQPLSQMEFLEISDFFQYQGLTKYLTDIEKHFISKYITMFINVSMLKKISIYEQSKSGDTIYTTIDLNKIQEEVKDKRLFLKYVAETYGNIEFKGTTLLKFLQGTASQTGSSYLATFSGENLYVMLEQLLSDFINDETFVAKFNNAVDNLFGGQPIVLSNNTDDMETTSEISSTEYMLDNNYTDPVIQTIERPVLSPKISAIMYRYATSKFMSGNNNVDIFNKIPNIYNNGYNYIGDSSSIYCALSGNINSTPIKANIFDAYGKLGLMYQTLGKDVYQEIKSIGDKEDMRDLAYYYENNLIYRGVFEQVQLQRYVETIGYPDIGGNITSYCAAIRNFNNNNGENSTDFAASGIILAVDDRNMYDRDTLMRAIGKGDIDAIVESLEDVKIPEVYTGNIKQPRYGRSSFVNDEILKAIYEVITEQALLQSAAIKSWFDTNGSKLYYIVDQNKIGSADSKLGIFNVVTSTISGTLMQNLNNSKNADSVIFLHENSVLILDGLGIFSAYPFIAVDRNPVKTDVEKIGFKLNGEWLDLDGIYNMDLYTRKDYLHSGLDIIAAITNIDGIGTSLYNEYITTFQKKAY